MLNLAHITCPNLRNRVLTNDLNRTVLLLRNQTQHSPIQRQAPPQSDHVRVHPGASFRDPAEGSLRFEALSGDSAKVPDGKRTSYLPGLNNRVWTRRATDSGTLYRVIDLRRPIRILTTPGSSLTNKRTVSRPKRQREARSLILK